MAKAHGPTSHLDMTSLVSEPDRQPGRATQASSKGQCQAEQGPSEAGSPRKAVHAEHTPVHAIGQSCRATPGGSASQGSKRRKSLRRHSASQSGQRGRPSWVAHRRRPPPRQIQADKDEGSQCARESSQPPRHERTDQGDEPYLQASSSIVKIETAFCKPVCQVALEQRTHHREVRNNDKGGKACCNLGR